MGKLKAILFDFDGTVADTMPVCFVAYRRLFKERLNEDYSNERIEKLFGPDEEGILRKLLPGSLDESLEQFWGYYREAHDLCKQPFEGVEDALARLKEKGLLRGLVTGKGSHSLDISLEVLNLAHQFDAIEPGSPEGNIKQQAMRRMLAKCDLKPDEAAYVGDMDTDIEHSKAVGVLPIAAAWADSVHLEKLEAEEPALIFKTVQAFTDWIDSL